MVIFRTRKRCTVIYNHLTIDYYVRVKRRCLIRERQVKTNCSSG